MLTEYKEKKRWKEEKKQAKEAKFREWESEYQIRLREDDAKKVQIVREDREKREREKTSFEKNLPKYEIWSGKDDKGKMLIDRYNMHRSPRSETGQQEQRPASSIIASKLPPNRKRKYPQFYTPKCTDEEIFGSENVSSSCPELSSISRTKNRHVPKPTDFSTTTVQLKYENSVCYWPANLITVKNLIDRFNISRPVLKAEGMPNAKKITAGPDERFTVVMGYSYLVLDRKTMKKDRKKPDSQLDENATPEAKVMRFLTLDKFSRGEILVEHLDGRLEVKEEFILFDAEGGFMYKEFRGLKNNSSSRKEEMFLTGKYKVRNNNMHVIVKFKKPSKKQLLVEREEERKELYSKWFIPGDGTLQCFSSPDIKFK